jgi:Fe-S-cluster containining protein
VSKGSKIKRDKKKKMQQKKQNIKQSQIMSSLPSSSLSIEEINRLIAYKGCVGLERKEWSESFISWKTEELTKITTEQMTSGQQISCSKGCSFCCSQYVGASLQECDAIVYWIYQHDHILKDFLLRYPAWRNRLKEHGVNFNEIDQAANICFRNPDDASAREVYLHKTAAYGQLDIPCPFLDDGSCSIYPVRPFVCAAYVVVSPPENCKSSSHKDPIRLIGAHSPLSHPSYFRGPKNSVILSPVAQMVQQILIGGYMCLNDIPGFDGLQDEIVQVPEVRAILKGI